MVYIDTTCDLENFRHFLIQSTCMSFMPENYFNDPDIFPEKEGETGSIYIEAADKVSLKKIRDITFVNAQDILGIIYVSKSGNTKLKWRESREELGKLTGEASTNSLVNLFSARVLSKEYTDQMLLKSEEGEAPPEESVPGEISDARTNKDLEGTLNVEGDV